MTTLADVAEMLKQARRDAHMSQALLAAVLNMSLSTVRQWENGDKKPSGSSQKLLHLIESKGLETVLCLRGARHLTPPHPRFASALVIRASASSSVARAQPKLSRTKPGRPKALPSDRPTPAASKNSAGCSSPAARQSIQAR